MGDKLNNGEQEPDQLFASLKFKGDRFKKANLPVDLLDNIKSYHIVLLLLAEKIWREKNPDRANLPPNFKKNLSLSFSHVKDGSADAILKADTSIRMGMLPDEYAVDYLDQAQNRFISIVKAANKNESIESLPPSAKPHLTRLLSGVREGERLQLNALTSAARRHNNVRFSNKTLRRLVKASSKIATRNIEGMGLVCSILDDRERIRILSEHGVFEYPVDRDRIRSGEFEIASFVEFSVFSSVDSNCQIKSVEQYLSLDKLSPNAELVRLNDRLDYLSRLDSGWKNGEGKKIKRGGVQLARDMAGFVCNIYSKVSAFPELDGSINIEFSHEDIDVILTCKKKYISLVAFDDSDADPVEQVFFGVSPKLLSCLSDLKDFLA